MCLNSVLILSWLVQAILAVIKGLNGKARGSAYVLRDAILTFFTKNKLFPTGIYADIPSVADWGLRHGLALKKLAPGFQNSFKVSKFVSWEGMLFSQFQIPNVSFVPSIYTHIYIYTHKYIYIYMYLHIHIYLYIHR